jgi:hypothetical protein
MSFYIIIIFILLLVLPGVILLLYFKNSLVELKLNFYNYINYGYILSIFIFFILSDISYKNQLSYNLIYTFIKISALILTLLLLNLIKINWINIRKIKLSLIKPWFLVGVLIISSLVGYSSQFEASHSDTLVHIANIRNIINSDIYKNCDALLGYGYPSVEVYGCNPLNYINSLLFKIANVDPSYAHMTLSGILVFLFITTSYTLMSNVIKNDNFAKISSLIFINVNIINSIYKWGPSSYFFDPIGHLIFPYHFASNILMIIFINFIYKIIYKPSEQCNYLFLLITFYLITRTHPLMLLWVTLYTFFVLIYNFRINILEKYKINYKLLFSLIFIISLVNYYLYISCDDVYKIASSSKDAIELWTNSGNDQLIIQDHIYISSPIYYLSSRGWWDILILICIILIKNKLNNNKKLLQNNTSDYNLISEYIYISIVVVIYFVIFNPVACYFLIDILNSPIPIYRAFLTFNSTLQCLSIVIISKLLIIYSPRHIKISITTIFIIIFSIYIFNYNYIDLIFKNRGNYFSTNQSISNNLFGDLRNLENGRVAIHSEYSTPLAAFTNLDPIIAEGFRSRSLDDYHYRLTINNNIINFKYSCENLINKSKEFQIKYIVTQINKESILSKNCAGIRYISTSDDFSVWQVTY